MAPYRKSERCPECFRRHLETHEHVQQYGLKLEEEIPDSPRVEKATSAPAVSGTPQEIIERARTEEKRKTTTATKRALTKDEALQQERARIEQVNLCVQIVKLETMLPVMVTGDPRWRTYLLESENDLKELSEAYNRTLKAFGVEFAGKWSSLLALAIVHINIVQKISERISQEDAQKKDEKQE